MRLIIQIMAVLGFARVVDELCGFPEWFCIVLNCVFSACSFVYLTILKERAEK